MMIWEYALRLLIASIFGAIIGLDREYRAKEAGYRTHLLVSLGSALLMIISQYGFDNIVASGADVRLDPSRVAAAVVTGIGFIGAGTIVLQKHVVRGLTTAAGMWVTSAIGLAVGAGMYALGAITTILTLIGLELLTLVFKNIGLRSSVITFTTTKSDIVKKIAETINDKNFIIVAYKMERQIASEGVEIYHITMTIKTRRSYEEGRLLSVMQDFPDITIESLE